MSYKKAARDITIRSYSGEAGFGQNVMMPERKRPGLLSYVCFFSTRMGRSYAINT